MIKWERSGLRKGDRVKIQESMLVTRDGKRFERAEYVGETKFGLILKFFFEPGPLSEDTSWNYRVFVDWSALYSGDVKLQTADGRVIKANRLFERR